MNDETMDAYDKILKSRFGEYAYLCQPWNDEIKVQNCDLTFANLCLLSELFQTKDINVVSEHHCYGEDTGCDHECYISISNPVIMNEEELALFSEKKMKHKPKSCPVCGSDDHEIVDTEIDDEFHKSGRIVFCCCCEYHGSAELSEYNAIANWNSEVVFDCQECGSNNRSMKKQYASPSDFKCRVIVCDDCGHSGGYSLFSSHAVANWNRREKK